MASGSNVPSEQSAGSGRCAALSAELLHGKEAAGGGEAKLEDVGHRRLLVAERAVQIAWSDDGFITQLIS